MAVIVEDASSSSDDEVPLAKTYTTSEAQNILDQLPKETQKLFGTNHKNPQLHKNNNANKIGVGSNFISFLFGSGKGGTYNKEEPTALISLIYTILLCGFFGVLEIFLYQQYQLPFQWFDLSNDQFKSLLQRAGGAFIPFYIICYTVQRFRFNMQMQVIAFFSSILLGGTMLTILKKVYPTYDEMSKTPGLGKAQQQKNFRSHLKEQ